MGVNTLTYQNLSATKLSDGVPPRKLALYHDYSRKEYVMTHELIQLENEIRLFEDFISNSEEMSPCEDTKGNTFQPIGEILKKQYGMYLETQ